MHLVSLLKEEIGWGPSSIADDAMEALKQYAWPGNVRELRNVLERVMIVSKDNVIRVADLAGMIRNNGIENAVPSAFSPDGTLRRKLEDAEKRIILETLRHAKGNKLKTAKVLGIHRSSLYERLKRMGYVSAGNDSP
jgi:DNA-binding NtrC family response regulator